MSLTPHKVTDRSRSVTLEAHDTLPMGGGPVRLVFRLAVVALLIVAFTRLVNNDLIRDTIRTDIRIIGQVWDGVQDVWDDSKKDRRK